MNYFSTLRVHAYLSSPVFGLKHAFVLKNAQAANALFTLYWYIGTSGLILVAFTISSKSH